MESIEIFFSICIGISLGLNCIALIEIAKINKLKRNNYGRNM